MSYLCMHMHMHMCMHMSHTTCHMCMHMCMHMSMCMSLVCVVMIDLGNLRDQIFPRTGFAPNGEHQVCFFPKAVIYFMFAPPPLLSYRSSFVKG